MEGSPCIDTGDPSLWYEDVDGTRADMGVTGGLFVLPNFTSHDFGEVGDIGSNKQFTLYNYRETSITISSVTFGTSSLFLVSYVIYHWFKAGPKLYAGEFITIYYFILISHILLAIFIIPLALITLYRGWNMEVAKHRKIAKITYPIWLYVSVTGVMIYLMLY